MDLGERFKRFRERAKLTQKEAAEMIGVKNYQLGNYETNRSEPSIEILKGMSRTYNVSIDMLVGNNRFKKTEQTEKTQYDVEEVLKSFFEYLEEQNKKL